MSLCVHIFQFPSSTAYSEPSLNAEMQPLILQAPYFSLNASLRAYNNKIIKYFITLVNLPRCIAFREGSLHCTTTADHYLLWNDKEHEHVQ